MEDARTTFRAALASNSIKSFNENAEKFFEQVESVQNSEDVIKQMATGLDFDCNSELAI